MDQRTIKILFALLRSAISGVKLTENELKNYSALILNDLHKISKKHDIEHLLFFGLRLNELISDIESEEYILKAVYRYERMRYEYDNLCYAFEEAQIPFIPLKGSVIRKYYHEEWMRTSCDIDILVHREDLGKSIAHLSEKFNYVEKERTTHDISLVSTSGINVELHFDLVEEGRANNAIYVLQHVWENVALHENKKYWYEMNDEFFYFYHIAHMAKHFETGGCGIRAFLDLWILDSIENMDQTVRDGLLAQGGLLKFARTSRKLSRAWFGEGALEEESLQQLQEFVLNGGVYGTTANRISLQQANKGGKIGYILSRLFLPFETLKRYYPILEKHSYLTPLMQIRRWFKLCKTDKAKKAKREIGIIKKTKFDKTNDFLNIVGLD